MSDRKRKGRGSLVDHGLKPHNWEPGFNESDKKMKKKKADEKSCLIVDDDLVVIQILSRLPVKSLMRFKSVCKSWKSIIEQDLNFMNLHYTHSEARPGLFIVRSKLISSSNDNKKSIELSMLSVDLQFDDKGVVSSANLQSVKRITQSCSKFLGPLRGLICFVDRFSVQIFNCSTGELATPWITSTVLKSVVRSTWNRDYDPTCCLGFDPATGNHKVMFMWSRCKDDAATPVCEVLTVGDDGDARFRVIDSVPPPPLTCKPDHLLSGVYGNCGSVYWFTSQGTGPWNWTYPDPEDEYSESLIAFDFGSEQFRIIPIPKFTLTEQEDSEIDCLTEQEDSEIDCHYMSELIEMDGCPTMARHYVQPNMVRMWRFHDGTTSDWTQVTIRPPCHMHIEYPQVFFHSILGKDLMILEAYDNEPVVEVGEYYAKYGGQCVRNVKAARLYFHDLKNDTFRQFKVEGISWLPDDCYTECTPLVESLFLC